MKADPSPRIAAESTDAEPRLVAAIAGALAFLVLLGLAAGALTYASHGKGPSSGLDGLFQHGPAARTGIEEAWSDIGREATEPDGYAWIDRRTGIVRIPLSRAIDLVCAEQPKEAGSADSRRTTP